MKIYTTNGGVPFNCECGISGEAIVASDFNCTRCNGENNYYIVCPNCGKKHHVPEKDIPSHAKPYISTKVVGFGNID